uniref:ABTB2/3 histone-like domain-containing protein n=1 Tax=Ditylenchus dipsaci TaxID=166011 RepID=A0A915CYN4_9BILA
MAPIVHNGAINGQYKIKHHKSQSAINFQGHIPIQLSTSVDHQQPSSSTSNALPRLSQALKSLRMSSFLSSSNNNSAKSKPAFVDADDVIYYSNKEENNSSDSQKKGSPESSSNGHVRLTAAASLTNFKDINEPDYQLAAKENHREYDQVREEDESRALPANDVYRHNKALAEIRQLYKSTPNFSLLEDELYEDSYEGHEEPLFSVSRHSTGREVDSLGLSMSSSSTSHHHHPTERPIMGTRRKVNSSNSSTATSSTTASSTAQSGNPVEISSPTDSGYLSRRQTPRHVISLMSSSTKNLTTLSRDTANSRLLSEEITERAVDVAQEPTNMLVGLDKRPESSKQPVPSTKFRKYCWAEHIQSCSFASTKSPFTCKDVLKVIEQHLPSAMRNLADSSSIALELTELMNGIFHEMCVEICRLSSHLLKCSSNDICTAAKLLILPETIALNCINAGIQAISLYGLGGSGAVLRVSMSTRAGLRLDVGKFYRFMVDSRLATVVTDSAAIFLTAVVECALVEAVKFLKSKGNKASSYLLKSLKKYLNRSNQEQDLPVCAKSVEELLKSITNILEPLNNATVKTENSCGSRHFENSALLTLFYFIKCKGDGHCLCLSTKVDSHGNQPSLQLWLKTILLFVHHRLGSVIVENDVFQAARILLTNFECPPCTTTQLLAEFDINLSFNQFSKSILTANEDEMEIFMLNRSKILDLPVQALNTRGGDKKSTTATSTMDHMINPLSDFDGWTPLTWAVALENTDLVTELLHTDLVHVQDPFMTRESPFK